MCTYIVYIYTYNNAGTPSVPCPFIGEQRFWALQLQDLGVANTQVSQLKHAYIYIYTHTHTHTHTHAYIHTYIYTHTYIYFLGPPAPGPRRSKYAGVSTIACHPQVAELKQAELQHVS